jgi:hypothetical protein
MHTAMYIGIIRGKFHTLSRSKRSVSVYCYTIHTIELHCTNQKRLATSTHWHTSTNQPPQSTAKEQPSRLLQCVLWGR